MTPSRRSIATSCRRRSSSTPRDCGGDRIQRFDVRVPVAPRRRPLRGRRGCSRAVRQEQADRTAKLLDEARQAAQRAEGFEKALGSFRDATAVSGFDVSVLLEYARFLIKNSRGSTAEGSSPCRWPAMARRSMPWSCTSSWCVSSSWPPVALDGHCIVWLRTFPAYPRHSVALDYAIPHRLDNALQAIGTSADPVNPGDRADQ